MKEVTWDNPNKMHFESAFVGFNKQVDLIATGNVLGNVQTSLYVRPYNNVKNGSYEGEPGQFMKFDLRMFEEAGYRIPVNIRKILEDPSREQSYCLYNFHYWKGDQKEEIGWVLTDYNHKLVAKVPVLRYGTNASKRISALNECAAYVCA